MVDTDINAYWVRKRAERSRLRAEGLVEVTRVKGRYQVVSPYNERFRLGMLEMGARWRERSECWTVRVVSRRLLIDLIKKCYGADKVPEGMR